MKEDTEGSKLEKPQVGPKKPDLPAEVHPQQSGNRQTDHQTAAAQARQTFKTPHDMTYATPNSTLVGKESLTANGTPILQTKDGLYKGTLNERGNISQWQPIKPDGTEIGKPIQVTAERTGAPPAGIRPELYVAAPKTESAKAPEVKADSKEPTRSEHAKYEYPKAEPKNSFEAQKELYESHKQHFDPQRAFMERAAQQLANPISMQEKSEPKTTRVDHISVTPAQPEYQRASNPFSVFAQKLERTIAGAPNTIEYAQKFVNDFRDSRPMVKPSLENTIQQPQAKSHIPEGLNVKPEPLSDLKIHQDLRTHFVSPLQGLSEPFTFKPQKPITRSDIIEQIGDISKGKIPSVAALVALLLAGRKTDVKEPVGSKAIENLIKGPRLEPTLQAILPNMKQPQKDKLVEIANRVKDGKTENLGTKDLDIAKRIQQLQPKQIDALIAWAQNKSPIKFDILPHDFQTKLSSIMEHVVKATVGKTEKAPVHGDKPPAVNRTLPVDKTIVVGEKTVPVKPEVTKLIQEPKTENTKPLDVSRQVKGAGTESDKTVKIAEFEDSELEVDDDTKPSREKPRKTGTLYGLEGPPKRRRRTKPIQETEVLQTSADRNKLPSSATKFLSNTVKRTEAGSLVEGRYNIILETLFVGKWHKVIELTLNDDDALFITYKLNGNSQKQSIGVPSKLAELIENNFFKNWQGHVNKFLGVNGVK